MAMAHWLIVREIVQELQGGEDRAKYGKQFLEKLSSQLSESYGSGFSIANLKNFRQFYLTYPNRFDNIRYPPGSESVETEKRYPAGSEFGEALTRHRSNRECVSGFSNQLSWSHYRALKHVPNDFAVKCLAFYTFLCIIYHLWHSKARQFHLSKNNA